MKESRKMPVHSRAELLPLVLLVLAWLVTYNKTVIYRLILNLKSVSGI